MNEPLNAKVAKQAKARSAKVNYFDDPKTTTSPQKQDTGVSIPSYMPKKWKNEVKSIYKDNPERAKQVVKNMFTKPDNRL